MHIRQLIRDGALIVINHSGGKDSQAMTIRLQRIIPASQLVIVHAHLPDVEWEGSLEHIQATSFGIPVLVTESNTKTFLSMVEHRHKTRPDVSPWPSPSTRQCTSDLKRAPIERAIRHYAKQHGFTLIVSCMGMRAQESPKRAKQNVFKLSVSNSVAGRTWYNWLPIHKKTTRQVFKIIQASGQKPFWTYAEGMSRKSCCFCIMASKADLTIAARLKPELLARYSEIEHRTGYTMSMPDSSGKKKFLDEITRPEGQQTLF